MPKRDTLDKVFGTYLAALCSEPFTYRGKNFQPRPLHVSPLLLRGYVCLPGCGGCCPRFSLDYLPDEPSPQGVTPRLVEVAGVPRLFLTDTQGGHTGHFCRHLRDADGRCSIYEVRPFACDFELIRVVDRGDHFWLGQKLFGRGWAMTTTDGARGAKCFMTPPDPGNVQEVVRKLLRLKRWSNYVEVNTRIDAILGWIHEDPSRALLVD